MKILVLNVGSSSAKYAVFENEKEILRGLIEKIGERAGRHKTHEDAIEEIKRNIDEKKISIDVIGHRVVHGGQISESTLVDNEVLKEAEKYSELAPLHNPHEINAIRICKKFSVPQVAVFDTSFHQTIPQKAYTYAIPKSLTKKYGIRKYGFHGISHKYIASMTKGKTISCHLGNGASITAIIDGKSVDTSMGFTPCEGIVMGTRTGDIDPGTIIYLFEKEKLTPKQAEIIFNEQSGLLGISGKSKDMRELLEDSSKDAKLTIEVFCYRIAKYIGAYAAAMNGVDCIVFTAGIGENSPLIRKKICDYLKFIGVSIDDTRNNKNNETINSYYSKVNVKVIKTNEELMIAREVMKTLKENNS